MECINYLIQWDVSLLSIHSLTGAAFCSVSAELKLELHISDFSEEVARIPTVPDQIPDNKLHSSRPKMRLESPASFMSIMVSGEMPMH